MFVGKEFDSISGRGGDGEPVRMTPWGEIAWQLGGHESFRAVEKHDREFIEPKGDSIRAMLPKGKPSLILMDEIISYVSTYRSKGYGDRLYNFIDGLAETRRGESNVVLVVSIPASELEYTSADIADEARFKKMLDRVGKAISMASDTEVNEIIRRRLFDWHGLPDDAKKTAAAYAEWTRDHGSEIANMGEKTRSSCSRPVTRSTRRSSRCSSESGKACPLPANAGDPSIACALGFLGLPRRAPESIRRSAHHARLRAA